MKNAIKRILKETDYPNNRYLAALRDGTFERKDFVETQIQFFFAVVFFSRPMAAIAAKIPDARQRVEVLRNVWEEHGEGDSSLTHSETFAEFLRRLQGIEMGDIDIRTLWPEVRIFNTTLAGAGVLDEYAVSVGMMGMIELMFSDISSIIGNAVVEQGWLKPDQMIHYNLHQDLDIKHSDDFFEVLEPLWEQGTEHRYYIEQGLRLGATVFNDLYEGLYRGRQRRWQSEAREHHVRA